ncbi:MAG: hypothetical protein RLZZ416_288 [Candidatus Parcubacteria bacterium]
MGDREANIGKALAALAPEIVVEKISTLRETDPMYNTEQPKFLNAVVEARTDLLAQDVLKKVKAVEMMMGEHEHNKPRAIDLDLLFYADEIVESPDLTVPHPKLAERKFVLEPLVEIAQGLVHPALGVTVAELLKKI